MDDHVTEFKCFSSRSTETVLEVMRIAHSAECRTLTCSEALMRAEEMSRDDLVAVCIDVSSLLRTVSKNLSAIQEIA